MDIDHRLLMQTFVVEALEHLTTLEEAVLGLERAPDDDEMLLGLFRIAHSLKGDAAIVGLSPAVELAHGIEDVLAALRERRVEVSGVLATELLHAIDLFQTLVRRAAEGDDVDSLADSVVEEVGLLREVLTVRPKAHAAHAESHASEEQHLTHASNTVIGKTLRVSVEKLDRILNLAGEISVARSRMRRDLEVQARATGKSDLVEQHRDADHLYAELQELVTDIRMVPIGPAFHRCARIVRDLGAELDKEASLVIEGEDVELDTTVIDHLRDPLTHMVRNAMLHGIETPAVRESLGKDRVGTIWLRARHEAGGIVIEVEDDGKGLSRAKILERAATTLPEVQAHKLSQQDVFNLLLEPGFSTATEVTEHAGRGVGLDVVRRNIDGLRGTVQINGEENRGTILSIRLPLTLAIIDGFAVGVGDETYVIPLDSVVECITLEAGHMAARGGSGIVEVRERALPFVRLREVFRLPDDPPERENVVVVQFGDRRAGLTVDTLKGEMQTVIKPLAKPLHNVPAVAGAAILGDGRVGLILDVPSLVRQVIDDEEAWQAAAEQATASKEERRA